jgi:phosphoglycolate phosphatase-like HAD superfamily hydrolase
MAVEYALTSTSSSNRVSTGTSSWTGTAERQASTLRAGLRPPFDRIAGWRPLEISVRQLESAGLIDLFERRFSVDETVRRHKPAPEAYASVVGELGADPRDICLIACHTWDTIGAVAAGWNAALVLRAGNAQLDVGPQPHLVGRDLHQIADQLIGASPI